MEQPGAFFLWVGVCALVSWRTAFQMPDGFGNAIFGLQLLAAAISSVLMAMYLPSLVNRNFKIITGVSLSGNVHTRTIPRKTAVRGVAIALAVFLAGNLGGYALDRAMGLPDRYAEDAMPALTRWVSHDPALATCLASVWAPATTCSLVVVVTADANDSKLRASVERASCGSATALERCATESLRNGAVELIPRRHASFEYAGETRLTIVTMLVGTGPLPPGEHAP